jgi:predicted DNA-binding transcriptional regulator AlpA
MRLLTYKDIAERTGLSVNALWMRKSRGQMPPPTVDNHQPLWSEKEIEKWMRSNGLPKPS